MEKTVTVLGAGIVGICCARELQKRGFRVTLLDRREPGEETSSGNAGLLSYSNITPLADPALLPRLHRLILNRETDFRLHYPHVWRLLPWLLRFLLRCNRKTYLADGTAMNAITRASIEMHLSWIDECQAQSLLTRNGGLKLYRDQSDFDSNHLERELFDLCQVSYSIVEAEQIRELEPDLNQIFCKGVLIDQTPSLKNPQKLCKAYAQDFIQHGGVFEKREIHSLEYRDNRWQLNGEVEADKLVICLGAWTGKILKLLGYANPMAIERGYHTVFSPQQGKSLSRPIFDVSASYVMAPMEMGLRVSSGSNLVYQDCTADPRQLEKIRPRVAEAFPVDSELMQQPWMGRRPTVPDTLPLIGPAPRHRQLWFAFAHSHMGLTMGPMTGNLIANFISGDAQPIPVAAYSPARYLS